MPSPLNVPITPPRVAFIDQRTNTISREWYMFFLSLFQLTGGSSQSLDELQIGPPPVSFEELLRASQDAVVLPDGTLSLIDEMQKQVQALQSQVGTMPDLLQSGLDSLAVAPAYTPQIGRTAYGTFYDTTSQTAAAINTAYAMTFNTTDLAHGVTLGSPTSRVYVDQHNIYNIQFSAQLDKTSASKADTFIWLRVNGTDVANSATQVSLSGSSAATVAAWNFVLSMAAGDYFELMWSVTDTGCYIKAAAASAPVPGIPSIILTVTDNISGDPY